MLISRFGTAYADAYQISQSGEIDDWTITRLPVTAGGQWGLSGALDFFGTANYPYEPMLVSKKFLVTASTWAGVDQQLTALNEAMIGGFDSDPAGAGKESKLWGIERWGAGGPPPDPPITVWTYAKCTRLAMGEKVDGNSPPFAGSAVFGMEVEIEFFCRTGEWYAGTASATSYTPRFVVHLLDGSNNVLTGGTISNVLSASWEEKLDESGQVSFTVPATDYTTASLLSSAARFKVVFDNLETAPQGAYVYGIIEKDAIDATAEQPTRTIIGADMLRELQHYTMGWWCFYDNKDIFTYLLADFATATGWTVSTAGSAVPIYYRFDGDSWLAALRKVTESTGQHFRLTTTFRQLEWGTFFGGSASETFTNVAAALVGYDGQRIIGSLQLTSDRAPVINRIYPWGAGQDDGNLYRAKVSLFHLDPTDTRWSNIKVEPGARGVQTTITSMEIDTHYYNVADSSGFRTWPISQLFWCTDPANLTGGTAVTKGYDFIMAQIVSGTQVRVRGSPTLPAAPTSFPAYLISDPQLYLEDAAAYAADPHEAVVIFSDITLTDLSLAAFESAAAQLYERAAQHLATHKDAQITYALSVLNCPYTLQPGDIAHITYSGSVTRNGVAVDWVDIDTDLYVIGITRTVNADGTNSAVLEVSNVAKLPVDSTTALADSTGKIGSHATTVGSLFGPGGIILDRTLPYLTFGLADNETYEIAAESTIGLLTVICIEDGSVATFSITGANDVAYEINDPQEQYTATAGTDGMTNLYSGTAAPYYYYLENKRGGSRTYCVYSYMGLTE